jgi:hypothetical protein
VALAALSVATLLFTDTIHSIPLKLVDPLRLVTPGPGLASAAAAIFFLPQLAFALLGGWLALNPMFETFLTRRRPANRRIDRTGESSA